MLMEQPEWTKKPETFNVILSFLDPKRLDPIGEMISPDSLDLHGQD